MYTLLTIIRYFPSQFLFSISHIYTLYNSLYFLPCVKLIQTCDNCYKLVCYRHQFHNKSTANFLVTIYALFKFYTFVVV